ncbi:uncharacterized protein LOC117300694 isoform X1 [Asterias rubens]|uniref:uncharacterized protein LOC117300694 isoform X1 n=1 Tax=Asterias rubens TaxID=7604 RepID=UPI001455022E|nr:uncharacterized protein LOC117300694 isoform X1 [Asterias rubens]
MSTIPGGCFVAPDSLRRLNQKQHARQAKQQQASGGPQSPPLSPPLSPPAEVPTSPSLAKFITSKTFWTFFVWNSWKTCADFYVPEIGSFDDAPLRFSEMFSRSRSSSTPPGTPPLSPCISPRKFPGYLDGETPPPSPFLSPRKQSPLKPPFVSPLSKDAESGVETIEAKSNRNSLSQSL